MKTPRKNLFLILIFCLASGTAPIAQSMELLAIEHPKTLTPLKCVGGVPIEAVSKQYVKNLLKKAEIKPSETFTSSKIKTAVKNLPQDILLGGAISMACVFAHEMGHALMAKALCGHPIDINLGAAEHETYNRKPWFKMLGVTLWSLSYLWDPHGFAKAFDPMKKEPSPGTEILVCAAGPVSSFFTAVMLGRYLRKKKPGWERFPIAKSVCHLYCANELAALSVATRIEGTDGYRIVKAYKQWQAAKTL